jgi:hypothetical protein
MNTKNWRIRCLIGASTAVVTAVVALGATGAASNVFAAGVPTGPSPALLSSSSPSPGAQPAATGAKKQTLIGTYVESGNGLGDGDTLPPETQVALDSATKLTCPSGAICTITDTISVQLVDHNDDAGNLYCMPWDVDGNPAGEQGPFVGETSTDGLLTGRTWTDQESGVAAGKHTVQSFVFTQKGASLGSWTVTYNIYD